jgi:hypothetical protein
MLAIVDQVSFGVPVSIKTPAFAEAAANESTIVNTAFDKVLFIAVATFI